MNPSACSLLLAILVVATTSYSQVPAYTELQGPADWQTGDRPHFLPKDIRSRSGKPFKVVPDSVTRYTISPEGVINANRTLIYKYADSTRTRTNEFIHIEETESGRLAWQDMVHYGPSGRIDSIERMRQQHGPAEHIETIYFRRDSQGRVIESAIVPIGYSCIFRNTLEYDYNQAGQIKALYRQVPDADCNLVLEYAIKDMQYDSQGTLTGYDLSHAWAPQGSPFSTRVSNGVWYDHYTDNILYMRALEEYETYLDPASLLPSPPKHHLQNTMLSYDAISLYLDGRTDTIFASWKLENDIGLQTFASVKDGDTTITQFRQFSFDPQGNIVAVLDTSVLHQYLLCNTEYIYDIWEIPQTTIEHSHGDTWRRYTTTLTADSLDRITLMVQTEEFSDRPGDILTEVFEFHHTDATTSTTDQPVQAPLHIFPNPTSEYIQIDLPHPAHIHLDLFNAAGAIVLSSQWQHTGGNHRIDIDRLPAGLYLARVRSEGEARTATFVKN